jgi:hypothetical protein
LGDLGFNAGGGSNAGDQNFHLKPRRLCMNRRTCHPCGDEIKALNAVPGFAGATIPLCFMMAT